jgi:3-O-methylgallate 3,4-dioxygenase
MAKIVLGIGTSHSPMLSTPPELWSAMGRSDQTNGVLVDPCSGDPIGYEALLASRADAVHEVDEGELHAQWAACQAALEVLGDTIKSIKPDILVIVSADQREMLYDDNMPALLVYWGENIPLLTRPLPLDAPLERRAANWGFGDVEMSLAVDSRLGEHIVRSLIDDEFDVAQARYTHADSIYGGVIGPCDFQGRTVDPPKRQGIGHGWSFIVKRLLQNHPIPIVPIMQNATFPPNQPTPKRCYQLGAALRRAIESWPADKTVCVIASGGLSHFVTDEELDRAVLNAILEKDQAALISLPKSRLTSASGEIRNWITVAAACEALRPELVDYVPVYRSAAGTGGGWGFLRWIA